MSYNLYVPESVMAIFAHPDDIEFACAGTIARWVKHGARAAYVLCTSGDVGIAEAGMTKAQAAKIREAEQTAAANHVGVENVIFLGEPDGMVVNTLELRKKLVREIRRFKPEVVITGDPTMLWARDTYINHPDHRAVGYAAIDAVFPASGQPNLFEDLADEGLTAHKVRKLYANAWSRQDADTFVDISDTLELKLGALAKHESQMKDFDFRTRLSEWAADAAKGLEMSYAETFRTVTLVSDEDWEKSKGRVLD